MSKRGRPFSPIQRREVEISLQPKYLDTFDRVCYDPFFQKRKMGKRNEIIEAALDLYWANQGIEIKEGKVNEEHTG